jgi:hypothetical protein
MKMKPVTLAEAKMVWDSIEMPSPRKVAEKFDAAGRSVDCDTIAQWKREGWPSTSVADGAARAKKSRTGERRIHANRNHESRAARSPQLCAARRGRVAQGDHRCGFGVGQHPRHRDRCHERWRSRRRRRAPGSTAQGCGQHRQADEGLERSEQHGDRGPATDPGLADRRRGDGAGRARWAGTRADEDYPLRGPMEAYDEVLKQIREGKS